MKIHIKRVYEPSAPEDGARVLVDRLWPRGVPKAGSGIDHWMKEAAPSSELRKWFGHDPAKWSGFVRRYRAELEANPEIIGQLKKLAHQGSLTLLYAARDEEHNQAVVLREYLMSRGVPASR